MLATNDHSITGRQKIILNFRDSLFFRKPWIGVVLLIILSANSPFLLTPMTSHAQSPNEENFGEEQPFSSLNVRLSSRVISPPPQLIYQTVPLEDLRVARPIEGPPPQAAIIEDDHRQRIAVLSTDQSGIWQLYLLEPVPLDPWLPALFQCVHSRQCHTDRMPLTGGLACAAICLKEILETVFLNPGLNPE